MKSGIKNYLFKQGMPQEFELVDIGELYRNHPEDLTTFHRAEFYHILWFRKGNPTHYVDFNPIKMKPGTILFLNKDIVQRFDRNGDFDGKAILFTDRFFCKTENDTRFLRSSILFNDLFTVSRIQTGEKAHVFEALFSLMETESENETDSAQSDMLKNLLHNFLLLSERERRKQDFTEIKKDANLDHVMQFKELLELHYRQFRQVSYYAGLMRITEKRLNQATSKVRGKSPKELIDERVVLEAKRLLAHTTDSVKTIGFDLGFEEPTNFIKYFRKHCQSTPVEFRAQSTMA